MLARSQHVPHQHTMEPGASLEETSKDLLAASLHLDLQMASTKNWLVVWNINYIFPCIGNFIIPADELIFFRGGAQPPTRKYAIPRQKIMGNMVRASIPWSVVSSTSPAQYEWRAAFVLPGVNFRQS